MLGIRELKQASWEAPRAIGLLTIRKLQLGDLCVSQLCGAIPQVGEMSKVQPYLQTLQAQKTRGSCW